MTNIPADALHETWDSVYNMSLRLAAMIEAGCRQRDEQFDAMILIPRGSYYPANIVARELGFGPLNLLHACIHSYETGSTERNQEFELGQMPTPKEVQGKELLIIDEVCDTGHTLPFVVEYLKEAGAGTIRTGVLHHKPARNLTGFQPDWYVTETDKWIVYPWECSEERGSTSRVRRR